MKTKKFLVLIVIISTILMFSPIEVSAWIQQDTTYTYEVCNIINVCIAGFMRLLATIVGVSYITATIRYIRYSNKESKEKIKNVLIWLIIVIAQIMVLFFGSVWVVEVGMETYTYTVGERNQILGISGDVSNIIRIIAFILIVFYLIKSIVYFINSKQENKEKIKNLAKWQVVIAIIVIMLLVLARRW